MTRFPVLPSTPPARKLSGTGALRWLAESGPRLYRRDPAATPYQHPGWLHAWARQLPRSARPVVLTVRDTALALVHDEGTGDGAGVRPLGSPAAEYVRPVGPHADDPAVAAAFADALDGLARHTPVTLPDLPADSALGKALSQRPGWEVLRTSWCAAVPLPLSPPAGRASTRRPVQRRIRAWEALRAEGRVRYRRTRTRDELLRAWGPLEELHREQRGERSARLQELRDILHDVGPAVAFIATLRADDEPGFVAAQLCLHRGPRVWSLLPAMTTAPAWRRLEPGHALIRQLAEDVHTADDLYPGGAAVLALGPTRDETGQHTYKRRYQPDSSFNLTVAARPPPR